MADATIVVPCYNEADRFIPDRFASFAPPNRDIRFLFVNDGSTDATGQVLDTLCRRDPQRLRVMQLPHNMGKAGAVRQGMLSALDEGSRYVGYWDADLATPLEAIPAFCDLLDTRPEMEIVFGARVKLLGRRIERRLWRHYLGRVFATAAAWILGFEIYDTQCGAKLFRVTTGLRDIFAEPFVAHWIFDVEILGRFVRQRRDGARPSCEHVTYEYPLTEWRDTRGSKLRLRDFIRAPFDLARIYWRYLRS